MILIGRVQIAFAVGLLMIAMCSGCGSASSTAEAQSGKGDHVATAEYLHARVELLREWTAALPAGRAPMEKYVADVRAECGGILRNAPVPTKRRPVRGIEDLVARHAELEQDTFLNKLIEEGLEAAQRVPQLTSARRFAARVATIGWSNPAVTDLVHSYARIEGLMLQSQPQNTCARAREWVEGAYGQPPKPVHVKLPHSVTKMWDTADRTLKCGPPREGSVLAALRRYQTLGASVTTRHVELMELRLSFAESSSRVRALRSLVNALGLRMRIHNRRHLPSLQELKKIPMLSACAG